MDYEKKYKGLVGKIEKAYLYAQTDSTKAVLEEIHPQLKESEDERIRRQTLKVLHDLTLYANWLKTQFSPNEKQGEQKPAWSEEDEDLLNDVIAFLEDAKDCRQNALDCINWLKSLKQRIGG